MSSQAKGEGIAIPKKYSVWVLKMSLWLHVCTKLVAQKYITLQFYTNIVHEGLLPILIPGACSMYFIVCWKYHPFLSASVYITWYFWKQVFLQVFFLLLFISIYILNNLHVIGLFSSFFSLIFCPGKKYIGKLHDIYCVACECYNICITCSTDVPTDTLCN